MRVQPVPMYFLRMRAPPFIERGHWYKREHSKSAEDVRQWFIRKFTKFLRLWYPDVVGADGITLPHCVTGNVGAFLWADEVG